MNSSATAPPTKRRKVDKAEPETKAGTKSQPLDKTGNKSTTSSKASGFRLPGMITESNASDRKASSGSVRLPSKAPSGAPSKSANSHRNSDTSGQGTEINSEEAARKSELSTLLAEMNEEQQERYEHYRRSRLHRPAVKKTMKTVSGKASFNENVVIAVAGASKVYLGEIVEAAKEVQGKWGDTGPLAPSHIQEAYRIVRARGALPGPQRPAHVFGKRG